MRSVRDVTLAQYLEHDDGILDDLGPIRLRRATHHGIRVARPPIGDDLHIGAERLARRALEVLLEEPVQSAHNPVVRDGSTGHGDRMEAVELKARRLAIPPTRGTSPT